MSLLTRLAMTWMAIAAFIWPSWAKSGLPLIALLEPALDLGFVPLVLVEAWFLWRALPHLPKKRLLGASAAANAASILVVVPLTWAAWMLVTMGWDGVREAAGISKHSGLGKTLTLVFGGAWPAADRSMYWMVPVALLELLALCFVLSYGTERFIVRRFLPAADASAANKAVWRGNVATFGFWAVLCLVFLIFDIFTFAPWNADKEPSGGTIAPPAQVGALDLDNDDGSHEIAELSFAPDGEMLAIFDVRDRRTQPNKAELQIWDLHDSARIVTVPDLHANPFLYKQQLFWEPKGTYLLALDDHLTCVDPKGGKACPTVPTTPVLAAAFNKDGTRFVALDPNNQLVIYGTDAWRVQATLPVTNRAQDVRWTGDGKLAVLAIAPTEASGSPVDLTVLDPNGATPPRTQRLSRGIHGAPPYFVVQSPDGQSAVVASLELHPVLVNFDHLETLQEVALRDTTVRVSSAAFCNAGTLLLQYYPRLEHARPERGHSMAVVNADGKPEKGWFTSSARQAAIHGATQRLATSKRTRVRFYDLATFAPCN